MQWPEEQGQGSIAEIYTCMNCDMIKISNGVLKRGKNLTMVEITEKIAEAAGKPRGHYPSIRTIDAIQISAAIDAGAEAFLTNDKKLKQIKEIKILVLAEYL